MEKITTFIWVLIALGGALIFLVVLCEPDEKEKDREYAESKRKARASRANMNKIMGHKAAHCNYCGRGEDDGTRRDHPPSKSQNHLGLPPPTDL